MKPTVLSARRLVVADEVIDWPRISISADGIIESIEPGAPDSAAHETTLTAAFLDVHVHGAAGHDVMEASVEALTSVGSYLATRGVAHYLATTVTAPVEATLRSLEGIADAIESNATEHAAQIVGIHLEGPFLSHAKRGVHPPAEIQPPSIPLFERMQQAARGHIKLMTVAPETPGALELTAYATSTGVRVSMGHSDATASQARAGIAAGATSATHTFNAMRRLDHREVGIAGVVLDTADLYAELICDGIHVAPEFVRLWAQAKGRAHAILITDGISAMGMGDGEYLLGGLAVSVRNGVCLLGSDLAHGVETLAGSVLTLDRAVANVQTFTGIGLGAAVRMASSNPAQMLGLDGLGQIAVGQPASFNVYSSTGMLLDTVLRGRSVRSGNR